MSTSPTLTLEEKLGVFGGFRTRYLEGGDPTKPPLLFLHDGAWGGCSSVTWSRVMPLLADDFHVLAPDMLGFGGTDKVAFFDRAPFEPRMAHVSEFVRAVRPDALPHVVGTSFGGTVALRWLAAGAAVQSMTVLAGTGGPWRTRASTEGLRDWDGTREDMERLVELLVDRGPGFDALVDERFHWASVPGHYRATAAVGIPLPGGLATPRGDDPWPQQLATTTAPLHVVEGSRDNLLEPGWTTRFVEVRADTRVTVGDFRHSPNLDQPERVAEIIREGIAHARESDRVVR